jgi:sugar phosphate permease
MPTVKQPLHYAWVIAGTTFFALLVSSSVRLIPTIIIKPLEAEFSWDRASISLAVAISLFAFGFGAPLGGSLVERFGPKRVMLYGLGLSAVGLTLLTGLGELWHLHLLWGLVVGIGTGAITNVLGATIGLRWFNQHRGMILGLFGAATATGQLIFLPTLIAFSGASGWRAAIALMALAVALIIVPVVVLMRNRPEDKGLAPVGKATVATAAMDARFTPLRQAIRTRDFWLLAGSFFVCGYTTNGLIGTHLLPHTLEHGFVEAEISGALALMGFMNIFGTLASGWLSDRYDNRKLLAIYYSFRALSLAALPFILEIQGMLLFSIIYGLDWVATVPPTANLAAARFGRRSLGTIYGWIFCSHMIGAGLASYAGGFFRDLLGDYHLIFVSAAILGIVAAGLALRITPQRPALQAEKAASAG